MKTVQLISAPIDKGKLPLYEDGIFPPLGLMALLPFTNTGVEIIDGQHHKLEEILGRLDADIVGLSFNILSAGSLDQLAREAKRRGSKVVVGGQAATPLALTLMSNEDIDCVVRNDGDDAFSRLVIMENDPQTINNLVYRNGSEVIANPVIRPQREIAITRNHRSLRKEDYWERFARIKEQVNQNHHHDRPLATVSQKGCPIRINQGGCSFCSRSDKFLIANQPLNVVREFDYLANLGADRIEDFSDSFLHNKEWLRGLVDVIRGGYEKHWMIPVRVYADTRNVDECTIKLMKQLMIDSVILGVESGNEAILSRNFKPNTIAQIRRCVQLLQRGRIMCCPSFVLGLIGETAETLEDTLKLALEIAGMCEIEMSFFSIMTPFPGSRAWNLLLQIPEMKEKYGYTYHLDQRELQNDFLERFTELGPDAVDWLSAKIDEVTKKIGSGQRDY